MPLDIVIGSTTAQIRRVICRGCGESGISIHALCQFCVDCCKCTQCLFCQTVYPSHIGLQLCYTCGQCRNHGDDLEGCCVCMICRACNTPVTSLDRCPICYRGTRKSCGCCAIQSGLHFIKRDIKLEEAEPGESTSLFPSQRLCAAEIELSGFGKLGTELDRTLRKWKASVVHDGTVHSEINTAPVRRSLFIQQINEIYSGLALARAEVQTNAGCHIHVDARDFGYYEMAKLMMLWAAVEPALMTLVPKQRRLSTYCVPCGPSYYRTITQGLTKFQESRKSNRNIYRALVLGGVYGNKKTAVTKVKQDKVTGTRYRAVNVHSWLFRGSVEFRLPPGMKNPEDVIMWAAILSQVVDKAYQSEMAELQALAAHVSQIPPEAFGKAMLWPSQVREDAKKVLLSLMNSVEHRTWINNTFTDYHIAYDSGYNNYIGMCTAATNERTD